jgi:hypothetical protein
VTEEMQEKVEKELLARDKRLAQRRESDLSAILKTAEGRRFVWDLLGATRVMSSSFADTDRATAFNEGRRSIGLELLDRVQRINVETYLQMTREFVSEEKGFLATIAKMQEEEGKDE